MKPITLAVDAMGGDHGLMVTVPASVHIAKKYPHITLLLLGHEDSIRAEIQKTIEAAGPLDTAWVERLVVVHASEVVGMDELPSHAMRNKKNSSMRKALDLVKEGAASACVSAGNTGALMATARYVLKTMPGIDRPAIIAELPTFQGRTRVVDLGANVDSCAEHLFQFAVMGSALVRAIDKKENPRIGLLNIGVEEIKGNDQVKRTAHMLSACSFMNYVGYVEGDHFYSGEVDLVICDGSVGNVALKASEGLARLILTLMRDSFRRGIWARLIGLLALPALRHVKDKMDPSRYNGASLLGLNGIVVKSHGAASVVAFQFALEEAITCVENDVIDRVRDQIAHFVNQGLLL